MSEWNREKIDCESILISINMIFFEQAQHQTIGDPTQADSVVMLFLFSIFFLSPQIFTTQYIYSKVKRFFLFQFRLDFYRVYHFGNKR